MQRTIKQPKEHKSLNYLYYTIAFVVICGLTYSMPWLSEKALIWNIDGIAQHFPILAQFQGILQGHVHQSLAGWSWNLGAGGDQLTTFAYYVMGDPFSYLIALFPASKLEFGFQFLIILRLYCVGLAFMAWANRLPYSKHSKLIGTLIYTFSGYNFYVSMHHPFFLLPMIIFPLLAMGVEDVLQKRKWIPLAIATALALISNFYFAYVLAFGTFVYLLARLLHIRSQSENKKFDWFLIYRVLQGVFTGLLMSGIILIPTLMAVLQSSRSMNHAEFANGLFLYPFSYYLSIPNQLITSTTIKNFWFVVNIGGIAFLATIYVLIHFKAHKYLASVLSIIFVAVLLPQVSATINAFSTPSNRWLLLAVLPLSLATMIFVDKANELTGRDLIWLVSASVVLVVLVWATQGFTLNIPTNDLVTYGFLFVLLIVLVGRQSMHLKSSWFMLALTSVVFVSLISNGQGWLSPNNSRNTSQELTSGSATMWLHDYYDGAEKNVKQDKGFYRTTTTHNYYSHPTAGNNIPTFLGAKDLNSYYSIQNGYLYKFNESLNNPQSVVNGSVGQGDNRTTLLNLLGVKYLFAKTDILKKPQSIPYGFSFVRNKAGKIIDYPEKPVPGLSNHSGTVILKSNLSLPLAYLQEKSISTATYDSLGPLQREQALLQGAEVGKSVSGVSSIQPSSNIQTVSYTPHLYTQHIVNNAVKAVLYRMRHSPNTRYQQTAADNPVTLPENKRMIWAKATGVHPHSPYLQNVIKKNQAVIDRNNVENSSSLHLMDNDAQGRHLSYQLKIDNPKKYKNCELYLVIDGVKSSRHSLRDRINTLDANAVVSGEPLSKLQKIDRARTAIQFPDLGAYTLSVQTKTNSNYYRQLPVSNLSDYKDRQHVVLNLGYSSAPRGGVIVRFNGVKRLKFNSVKLMAIPFNKNYNREVTQLQRHGLQNLQVKNDRITGTTNDTNHQTILTTSIPYTKGWHLKVDGKNTPTYLVNKGFIGATIPKGEHSIVMTYATPGFKLGILVSIIGVLWLVGFAILGLIRDLWQKKKNG